MVNYKSFRSSFTIFLPKSSPAVPSQLTANHLCSTAGFSGSQFLPPTMMRPQKLLENPWVEIPVSGLQLETELFKEGHEWQITFPHHIKGHPPIHLIPPVFLPRRVLRFVPTPQHSPSSAVQHTKPGLCRVLSIQGTHYSALGYFCWKTTWGPQGCRLLDAVGLQICLSKIFWRLFKAR